MLVYQILNDSVTASARSGLNMSKLGFYRPKFASLPAIFLGGPEIANSKNH